MPDLIAPITHLHSACLEAHHEWGPGLHEDGFGLGPSDEVDSPEGFAAWLARLANESGLKGAGCGRGCTYRWIVEGDRVHGGVVLRHGLNDYVLQFGHIDYDIRPTSRRHGLATWALGRILDEARAPVPGPIETPGNAGLAPNADEAAKLWDLFASQVPLGRMGRPDEAAAAALFLAGDQSGFVTGTELFVDGGLNQV